MRIALVGYGRMGRELERLAPAEHLEVAAIYDIDRPLVGASPEPFDVAIDFTSPPAVLPHITWLAEHRRPMVVGTTGWYDALPRVREIVAAHGVGLLYAPNFSLGVTLFLRLVREAARAFSAIDGYDVAVHETHHRGKADAPSGTALRLAEALLGAWRGKTHLVLDAHGPLAPEALLVSAARVGAVTGEHTIRIECEDDALALTHVAHTRAAFARGALRAARWIAGRKGVFTLDDMLEDLAAPPAP